MNIKELVPVISILLSVRIAEYAMKKYKKQKDVEVIKKQKVRKQTKKYMITAPSILKVGLPCGIFFLILDMILVLSQLFNWKYFKQGGIFYNATPFVGFLLIALLSGILSLYGYIWKIEYDTQEIIYRSALGITRKYRIEDITRCVGKRRNQYRFYQGEKKIFQYEMDAEGDVYDLLIILKKRGIDEEELIPSTKEHCIVEPMIIRKILPIIGFCIITFFIIALFLTRDGEIWIYLLLGVIDLLLLYYSGVYWYDQLEVQDKLYKKDFLKKMRTVEFKEIAKVEQHKSIIEKEYIIIYVKGKKAIKIDRYNENVEVLLMRLKDEKIPEID